MLNVPRYSTKVNVSKQLLSIREGLVVGALGLGNQRGSPRAKA